jgi:hypothetical protein
MGYLVYLEDWDWICSKFSSEEFRFFVSGVWIVFVLNLGFQIEWRGTHFEVISLPAAINCERYE